MVLYFMAYELGGNRLCVIYRKLRATLDEYTTRVGQQAIVLCISPSKPNPVFKVFGAAPLENVVSVTVSRLTIFVTHIMKLPNLPNS